MAIREHLEAIFDELRAVGNDLPLTNRQCAILVCVGLGSLDFGDVADDLLGPAPPGLEGEAADEEDRKYDQMNEDASTTADSIVNDLQAVIDEWEED